MGYIHIRLYFWQIDMPDNLSIQQKGRLLLKSNIFYFKKQPSLLLIREVIWQASDFFGESSLKGGKKSADGGVLSCLPTSAVWQFQTRVRLNNLKTEDLRPVWPDNYIICLVFGHSQQWKFAQLPKISQNFANYLMNPFKWP